jgi:hypothetical protein
VLVLAPLLGEGADAFVDPLVAVDFGAFGRTATGCCGSGGGGGASVCCGSIIGCGLFFVKVKC